MSFVLAGTLAALAMRRRKGAADSSYLHGTDVLGGDVYKEAPLAEPPPIRVITVATPGSFFTQVSTQVLVGLTVMTVWSITNALIGNDKKTIL